MEVNDAMIKCDNCKEEFSLGSVKIDEATVEIKRQKIKLIYFTCPKCNKIYRIMLKDKQYDILKADLEKAKMRIRKNNGSGNEESARLLNSMVIKKHNRLRNHVDNLQKKFSGTFTFVASENNHEDKIIKYLP